MSWVLMILQTCSSVVRWEYSLVPQLCYSETDQMGFVYYGIFSNYYEVGRVEAFRDLGLSYRSIEEDYHVMMPVIHLDVRYFRPAFYDDLLTIKTAIKEMPTAKISFAYEVFNEAGEKINEGHTSLVFTSGKSRRPTRPPVELLDALKPYLDK